MDGEYILYHYKERFMIQITPFINGKIHGQKIVYDEDGKILYLYIFEHGKNISKLNKTNNFYNLINILYIFSIRIYLV